MLITKFNQFILEGVYDRTTGDIVDDIWKIIKLTKSAYDMDPNENALVAYDVEYREKTPNLNFNLQVIIQREVSEGAFNVDADIDDAGVQIRLLLNLNPELEPLLYSKLNPKLHDAIRHELEHTGQKPGLNWKSGKPLPTEDYIRHTIQTTPERIWEYFLLEDEVPAMVRGMYKQAKVEMPINTNKK